MFRLSSFSRAWLSSLAAALACNAPGVVPIPPAEQPDIVIVEGLTNLERLPAQFTFIGFPLNIQGRDGAPIRAVALVQ